MKENQQYIAAQECLEEIIKLCGAEKVVENALSLDDEGFSKFRKKRLSLIKAITDLVKQQEKMVDFSFVKDKILDDDFVEEIEAEVKRRTKGFLTVIPFRRLEKNKRFSLVSAGIDILYKEREDYSYFVETMETKELGEAVFEILMESETAIVRNYMSKRRYMIFMKENSGLGDEELDHIWQLYEENKQEIENLYLMRSMMIMRRFILEVKQDVEELQEKWELFFEEDESE